MAELRVVGDYVGPGEKKTAETLAAQLPDEWVLIANRSLPTRDQDDMDLVAVGENLVFLIEEKAWGPVVKLGTLWKVGRPGRMDLRPNPLQRVSKVARVLAGLLRQRDGYPQRGKLVLPYVVMSHPSLQLDESGAGEEADLVLLLKDAAAELMERDSLAGHGLGDARQVVIEFVSGWPEQKKRPEKIGSYTVIGEATGFGRAKVFGARDDVGRLVMLRCYPMDGWGPDVDPLGFVSRERQAIELVASAGRTLRSDPVFSDDMWRWHVVPIVFGQEVVSLKSMLVRGNAMPHPQHSPAADVIRFVSDAFVGLGELHAAGIVHRGIHPTRIAQGTDGKVRFLDLYLAHLDGSETIAEDISELADVGMPYRAPECSRHVGFAVPASDVFSLAKSLLWWLRGVESAGPEDDNPVRAELEPVAELLLRCLADKPAERPAIADVLEALEALETNIGQRQATSATPISGAAAPHHADATPIPEPDVVFEPGTVVCGRYELERELGRGGYATSWLARDNRLDQARVLKVYKEGVSEAQAKREFHAAQQIVNDRCARVYDVEVQPRLMLVVEHVPGENLADASSSEIPPDVYRKYALDVLVGLQDIHSRGLVHRDVTSRNIVVESETQRAKLIDFGIARPQRDAVTVVGTPPFIAPEIAVGEAASPRSDLYSLGVSFLQCMLGRWPYATNDFGEADKATVLALTETEERRLGPLGVSIARQFLRLVAASPGDRPDSAEAFAEDLKMAVPVEPASGEAVLNPTVENLRQLYRGSSLGNVGNRGLDDSFANVTYVPTLLDRKLTPSVLAGELDLVLLTGNPGDGKTSFLVTLREKLTEVGAEVLNEGPGGWVLSTEARTYSAVYDASESRDGLSSDELIIGALTPAKSDVPHTALIAINDGRLKRFFEDQADLFPEYAQAVLSSTRPDTNSRVVVVDLKRRSLAPTAADSSGLAGRVLDALTSEDLWEDCGGCRAREVCPILRNRNRLVGESRGPLLDLVSISHLRRQRRATLRDVRSAASWVITGDRSCSDVHQAFDDGMDLRLGSDSLLHDLAFDDSSEDYLVQEWSSVDPTRVPSPELERMYRARAADGSVGEISSLNRRAFFNDLPFEFGAQAHPSAYRCFNDFRECLLVPDATLTLLPRIVLGLSRILGAFGYAGTKLALRDGESDGWAVLREIHPAEFELRRDQGGSPFIEEQADSLTLWHPRAQLVITLDTAELILRAADGELIMDAAANAVKLELEMFAARLMLHPADTAIVVDPAGRPVAMRAESGIIEMVGRA